MTVEELLTRALHSADEYEPSADLFAKVQRSIEEDIARRRRIRWVVAGIATGLTAALVWIVGFLDIRSGLPTMPWWTVEVLAAAILIAIVLVFGPLIRRFGMGLTDEVFRSNEATSRRFLAVLDIAYYLIFTAYVLMSTSFSPRTEWGTRLAGQLESVAERIAGMFVVMGLLHAVTIAVLPVVGLVFSSNWRRAVRAELGEDAPEPDPRAEKADRVAKVIVWVAAAVVAWLAIGFLVGPGIFGLILGAD